MFMHNQIRNNFHNSKETGLEAYELASMKRNQIDTQRDIINALGCKGHNSRSFKLKEKTAQLLREYLTKYPENPSK